MSDFEIAAHNTVKIASPLSLITGCLFHFGQCCYRKIVESQEFPGLAAMYRDEEDGRIQLKCFQSLAFVPIPDVYKYFCILMESFQPIQDIRGFGWYFLGTWIGYDHIHMQHQIQNGLDGSRVDAYFRNQIDANGQWNRSSLFPIPSWNVCTNLKAGLARTNNSVEGWHFYWNAEIANNPRLSVFLRRMIEEDQRWSDKIDEFEVHPGSGIRGHGSKRRSAYEAQDLNLFTLF